MHEAMAKREILLVNNLLCMEGWCFLYVTKRDGYGCGKKLAPPMHAGTYIRRTDLLLHMNQLSLRDNFLKFKTFRKMTDPF